MKYHNDSYKILQKILNRIVYTDCNRFFIRRQGQTHVNLSSSENSRNIVDIVYNVLYILCTMRNFNSLFGYKIPNRDQNPSGL